MCLKCGKQNKNNWIKKKIHGWQINIVSKNIETNKKSKQNMLKQYSWETSPKRATFTLVVKQYSITFWLFCEVAAHGLAKICLSQRIEKKSNFVCILNDLFQQSHNNN